MWGTALEACKLFIIAEQVASHRNFNCDTQEELKQVEQAETRGMWQKNLKITA